MRSRIDAHDWSATPLGPADTWPQTLKTAVRIMLASRYSMFLWWGEHLINIYNDSYVPHLGQRHPNALGRPAPQVWKEIWDVVGPQTDVVFKQRQSTWNEELLLVMERNGFTEETYFTFAYSPVTDEADQVCGLLGICTDETARVLGRRRLRSLRDLADRTSTQGKTAQDAVRAAAATLAENPRDIPFALVYLLSSDGRTARLADTVRVEPGAAAAPSEIAIASGSDIWAFGRVLERRATGLVENLSQKCGRIVAGAWPEPVERAVVVPLAKPGVQDATAGFLVAGVSPRLLLDDEYRGFLGLTAGHIAGAIANARAYEEERKRAEALAEIDRAKTAFFSNVSHEFRTPLTLMLGPLEELLSKDRVLAPEDRHQLATAHRNSLRLLKLVNSLLDFSRIEAGRTQASYTPVNLAALTTELASNFRSAMQAAGLELIVDCPTLPEPVYVDREMWEKIVLNLLSNAFKFTFQGSVTVSLEARDNQAILRVSDTGTGVPDHELPHIFERFHRVEGARGRTFEGSGIGLALIQELVKLHQGTVQASSRFGQGSTFTVRIPFGSAHLPQDRVGPPAGTQAETSARADAFKNEALTWLANDRPRSAPDRKGSPRPRILLADDNADMREHVSRILSSEYEITAVSDGLAALKEALENAPDLVLSDVMMPGLDGFRLLRELRADARTREIPVILLSARAGEEARTEGISIGADDYLTKPFTARELAARVETRLNLIRLRRDARAQFETLLNQAPLGVFLVDTDFRFRQVNPIARSVFGDTPDLIGRRLDEVIHMLWRQPAAAEILRRFRHTLETGEPYADPEFSQQRPDRSVKEFYEWRIDRMPLPDGFGVVCYFRDISAAVEARNEISRSEERFRAFVTASSDAVYRMSP
ncbi:MAG TPA: ATP-binding protein, partial [Bryobacteraceae bacterium]|nr:ATP-binding protein [Bryobacteraceae bacterium]